MKRYKLRDVEAEQLWFDQDKEGDDRTNAGDLADVCNGRESWVPREGGVLTPQVVFEGRSGTRVVNVSDWLVRLSDTEFDVLTDRDFQSKYDTSKAK